MAISFGILLLLTFVPTTSAGFYIIEIKMTDICLYNDGDHNFITGPGDLYWKEPSDTEGEKIGEQEDIGAEYPCGWESYSELYSTSDSSASHTYSFKLEDGDTGTSNEKLWEGRIKVTKSTGGWVTVTTPAGPGTNTYSTPGITVYTDFAAYSTYTVYPFPDVYYSYNLLKFDVRVTYYPFI